MLRKRQYDYIYSGLNFLSLLWGLEQLQKNKTVLILNTKEGLELQTSSIWGLLNYFEYLSFKKKWQSSLGEVVRRDIFLPRAESYYFNNDVLLLGDESPRRNLLELKRKFKEFYPKTEISLEHFDEIIYKLAKDVFSSLQETGDYLPTRKEYQDHAVLLFLLEFSRNIEQKKSSKLLLDCLSPLRFYYLFEPEVKENVLILLLINLLPRFSFNERDITQELQNYFTHSGGEVKTALLEHINHAPNLELLQVRIQAVEGMLLSHSLLFFGAIPEEGVSAGNFCSDKHFWSEICLSIPKAELIPALTQGAKVFLIDDQTHSEQFGPVWLRFRGDKAYFYSFYNSRFGFNDKDNRSEFYRYLKSISLSKFNFELPGLSQFSQSSFHDQLSYWPQVNTPFLPAEFKNNPGDNFGEKLFYTGLSSLSYHGMSKLFWPIKSPSSKLEQNSSRGQTAVEYLLLLLVVATIGFALMKKLNEKLIGNAGDCTQGGDSLICKIQAMMSAESNFRYFRINK